MDPWSLYKLIPKLLFLTEIADSTNVPAIILIIYLHFKYLPVLFYTNHPYEFRTVLRGASLFNFQYSFDTLHLGKTQAVLISCNFPCRLTKPRPVFETEHPVEECAAGKHGVHAALSFTLPIIHPPAPSTSQPLLVRPVVPGSIPLPRIRRDGNLAESFAIYDGANAPPPATRAHLLRFIREQDEQRYPPVPVDNDITDIASARGAERKCERERSCAVFRNGPVIIMIVIINVTLYPLWRYNNIMITVAI